MLRSLFGLDWRKSPAHLLVLSKFCSPRAADDVAGSDIWKTVLKEDPNKAIKRFLDEGLLEQASLNGLVSYRYKVSELKPMLRQRGLPVSGRKADLIERLVQSDPEGMRKATRGLSVLQATEEGREIAEEYLAQAKEARAKVEKQTLQALRESRFREASQVVAAFEARQVFPRGIGIDWENHDPNRDAIILKAIFQGRPKALARLDQGKLEPLHLAAGMKYLWGNISAQDWLPPDFETGLPMDRGAVVMMLCSYGLNQFELASYRKTPYVKSVEIETCNDDHVCEACRELAARKHHLSAVPDLPYEGCTSERGCRCWYNASFEF